jgi:hypothetical protein
MSKICNCRLPYSSSNNTYYRNSYQKFNDGKAPSSFIHRQLRLDAPDFNRGRKAA